MKLQNQLDEQKIEFLQDLVGIYLMIYLHKELYNLPKYETNLQAHTLRTSRGAMEDPENAEDKLVMPEPLEDVHDSAPHSSQPRTRPRKLPGTARLLPTRLPKQGSKNRLDKLPDDMYRDIISRDYRGHTLNAIKTVKQDQSMVPELK